MSRPVKLHRIKHPNYGFVLKEGEVEANKRTFTPVEQPEMNKPDYIRSVEDFIVRVKTDGIDLGLERETFSEHLRLECI
jgi:hypothetical protein